MHADALARQVNAKIRELAEKFATFGLEDEPLNLLCECGCFSIVKSATLQEYDALDGRPLLVEGHALPPAPVGTD